MLSFSFIFFAVAPIFLLHVHRNHMTCPPAMVSALFQVLAPSPRWCVACYKSFLRKHQCGYVTKVIKIQYCNRNLPSSKAFLGNCKALTLSEISQIPQEAKVYSKNVWEVGNTKWHHEVRSINSFQFEDIQIIHTGGLEQAPNCYSLKAK